MRIFHYKPNKIVNRITINRINGFFYDVDKDFPVNLSSKTNIIEMTNKFVKNADVFIMYENNEIVGMVVGYISNSFCDKGYISVLAVQEKYRKQGIATSLLKRFLLKSKKANLVAVHLYTSIKNKSAIRLYESLGFSIVHDKDENRLNDLHLFYYFV